MLYRFLHAFVPALLRAILRPHVEGKANVPRKGGVIFASNHRSFIDSVMVPMVSPRPVRYLAKAEYFTTKGLKGFGMRLFFEGLNMLPMNRADTRAAIESLDVALDALKRGEAFGIYPEGTRSRDGRLYRGKTGVAHLALTASVPVVPIGLVNTAKLQPVGRLPRPWVRPTIRFGEPIQVVGRFDGVPQGKARRDLTDEIMVEIQKLCGQEYVEEYNGGGPAA